MAEQTKTPEAPRKFGISYPRGYVVVAFRTPEAAEQMRRSLMEGGYDDEDIKVLDTARVLAGSTADLEQLSPLVAMLGSESSTTRSHQEGAAAGHTFLVAYAPSELETDRLGSRSTLIRFAQIGTCNWSYSSMLAGKLDE